MQPRLFARPGPAACGWLLAGVLWAAAPPLWAQTAAPPAAAPAAQHAGFIKTVQGTVRLVDAAGQAQPAQPGSALRVSDSVQTGDDGSAGLVLRDGTTLVVGPKSRMDVRDYRFESTAQDGGMLIGLLSGSLRMITGLLGKSHPEAVRVQTQTATIGIRGTDFIVSTEAP